MSRMYENAEQDWVEGRVVGGNYRGSRAHYGVLPNGDTADDGAPLIAAGDEEENAPSAGIKDIALMIFINFLSFVCFAIVIPSLAVYVNQLQGNETQSTDKCHPVDSWLIGPLVAINSLGTLVGSPILGKWADLRTVRESILISLILMIVGNLMYVFSDFPSFGGSLYLLFVSRFVVGVASANYAPASAYLTYATSMKRRNLVMALNSAAGILGFIVGPAIAAAVSNIEFRLWILEFNELSNPGWVSTFLAVIVLFFLPLFREIPPQTRQVREGAIKAQRRAASMKHVSGYTVTGINQTEHMSGAIDEYDSSGSHSDDHSSAFDAAGIVRFAPMASGQTTRPTSAVSVGQGLGGSRLHMPVDPHMDEADAHLYETATQQSWGMRVLLKVLSPMLPDEPRKVPWVGVSTLLVIQFCVYLSYTVFETIGPPYAISEFCASWDWNVTDNGAMFAVVGVLSVVALVIQNLATLCISDRIGLIICTCVMLVGYGLLIWPNVPFPVFLAGVAISSMGFSAGVALLIALYSKLCNDVEQGVMMGWLSLSGSLSRVVGPIFASLIWENINASAVFITVCVFLFLALVVNVVFFMFLKSPSLEGDAEDVEEGEDDGDDDAEALIREEEKEILDLSHSADAHVRFGG